MSDFESKLAEYKQRRKDAVPEPVVTDEMLEFRKNVAYWASMTDEEARKAKMDAYTKERDDLLTLSKLNAAYTIWRRLNRLCKSSRKL